MYMYWHLYCQSSLQVESHPFLHHTVQDQSRKPVAGLQSDTILEKSLKFLNWPWSWLVLKSLKSPWICQNCRHWDLFVKVAGVGTGVRVINFLATGVGVGVINFFAAGVGIGVKMLVWSRSRSRELPELPIFGVFNVFKECALFPFKGVRGV